MQRPIRKTENTTQPIETEEPYDASSLIGYDDMCKKMNPLSKCSLRYFTWAKKFEAKGKGEGKKNHFRYKKKKIGERRNDTSLAW